MRRAVAPIVAVALVFSVGCRATPLPPDQLSVDEEEWIVKIDGEWQKYDEARRAGLLEDQNTQKHLLRRTADEHRELLVKASKCNDWKGRMVAVATLGFSAKDDVIGMLIGALEDPDSLVRSHALYGIAVHSSDQTPVPPILKATQDPDVEVRIVALGALGKILRRGNDRGSMPRVLELLSDPDWRVRCQAVTVLATIGRKDSIKHIVEKPLKDDSAEVRMYATGALYVIHEDESVSPLIGALTDPDLRVVETAQRSLEQLSGQKFGNEAARWQYWWDRRQELGLGLDHSQ